MRESKNQALDEGNCGAARRRGEEAGVKTASPRTGTGCEAGDTDKLAPHNGVRDSVSQVKPGVVPGKFTRLLGEACPTGAAASARSTGGGNATGQRAGVSRGRSSAGYEPGVGDQAQAPEPNAPDGLTQARRTELEGRTVNRRSLTQALTPTGRAWQWRLLSGETDTARGVSLAHS